jgi:hypothetical protein
VVEKSNSKNSLINRYEKLSSIVFPSCRISGFKLISGVSGVQIPAPPPIIHFIPHPIPATNLKKNMVIFP